MVQYRQILISLLLILCISCTTKSQTETKFDNVIDKKMNHLVNEQRPYLWARDMPVALAQKLVDHYSDEYHIFQITRPSCEVLDDVEVIKDPMSNMELVSTLLHSEKRILIDSCMQHAAAALKMPSVVLWNGTSPKVFGWDMHTNIQAKKPAKCKLPNSVLFDFDFTGIEAEYPYVDEDDEIFDFDKIVEAVG